VNVPLTTLVVPVRFGRSFGTPARSEDVDGFCDFRLRILNRDLLSLIRFACRLPEREQPWEWAEIIRGLENLQEVEAAFQGRRFYLRSQLVGQAHLAIRASGVAVPPTIREG
jgi:hypothetical protein